MTRSPLGTVAGASAALALLFAACAAGCDSRTLDKIETSAVRACIRSTACGVRSFPRISNCIDDLRVAPEPAHVAALAAIYHCVNAARSCADVERCFGQIGPCEQGFVASCNNGVAVTCDLIDKRVYKYDCGAVGASCRTDPQHTFAAGCVGQPTNDQYSPIFVADCRDGACSSGDGCNSDALSSCDGDRLKVCLNGSWVRYDCRELRLGPCEITGNGWGRCTPPS